MVERPSEEDLSSHKVAHEASEAISEENLRGVVGVFFRYAVATGPALIGDRDLVERLLFTAINFGYVPAIEFFVQNGGSAVLSSNSITTAVEMSLSSGLHAPDEVISRHRRATRDAAEPFQAFNANITRTTRSRSLSVVRLNQGLVGGSGGGGSADGDWNIHGTGPWLVVGVFA